MANKNIIANNFSLEWLLNSISNPVRKYPASRIVVKMLLNSNQSRNEMIVGSQQWEIASKKEPLNEQRSKEASVAQEAKFFIIYSKLVLMEWKAREMIWLSLLFPFSSTLSSCRLFLCPLPTTNSEDWQQLRERKKVDDKFECAKQHLKFSFNFSAT